MNLIVSADLDFAELQATKRRPMHMADGIGKLDEFLRLSECDILTHAGKISHKAAEDHALAEFPHYEAERRRLESTQPPGDFDKAVQERQRLNRDQKASTKRVAKKPPPPKTPKPPKHRRRGGD